MSPYPRLRLQYLTSYGLTGSFMPYAPLYLEQLGLTDAQIGYTLGAHGLAVLTMPLLTTYLADRHVPNRVLLRVCLIVSALALLALCDAGGFLAAFTLMLLFALASTSISSLTDGLTFALLHEAEVRGRKAPPYHALRIWGSIGFMLPTFVLYFLFLIWPRQYWIAMAASAGSCLLGAATTFLLPHMKKPPGETPGRVPTLEAFKVLRQGQLLAFIGSLFLINAAMYAFYNFFPRRLETVGVPGEWIGIVLSLGVVAEIIVMLLSGRILHHIGVKGALLAGAASVVLRMVVIAFVDSPFLLVLTQLLHGPTVLCLYLVPPMYLNGKATHASRNSMQGMYVVLCFGVARIVGSTLSGHFADLDLRFAFVVGAALSLVALGWAVIQFKEDAVARAVTRRAAAPIEQPLPEAP